MAPRAFRHPQMDRTHEELTRMYTGRNYRLVSPRMIQRIRKALRWRSPELQAQFEQWAKEQENRRSEIHRPRYEPKRQRNDTAACSPSGLYPHQTGGWSYSINEQLERAVEQCRREHNMTLTQVVREALRLYLAAYLVDE